LHLPALINYCGTDCVLLQLFAGARHHAGLNLLQKASRNYRWHRCIHRLAAVSGGTSVTMLVASCVGPELSLWTGAGQTHPLRHYQLTQADLTDVRELCGFKSIVRPTEVRMTSSAASRPSSDCASLLFLLSTQQPACCCCHMPPAACCCFLFKNSGPFCHSSCNAWRRISSRALSHYPQMCHDQRSFGPWRAVYAVMIMSLHA